MTLLEDVRWRGRPVAGDRLHALLAALAAGGCRPVRAQELVELVWGEQAPVNGTKPQGGWLLDTTQPAGANVVPMRESVAIK